LNGILNAGKTLREPTKMALSSQPERVPREVLTRCIQEQHRELLNSIRFYVLKFGLATGADVQPLADEIWQETVAEALAHADAYDTAKAPQAWLLGIAFNMLRRKRAARAKLERQEMSLSQFASDASADLNEDAVLDRLRTPTEQSLEKTYEVKEQVNALLALVSRDDQQVIIYALLEDFERTGLAVRLGLKPNAAGMRLRRALGRLRSALETRDSEGGK
jgi:DNA-directed RNA polymerase specialized sigma24 family protein